MVRANRHSRRTRGPLLWPFTRGLPMNRSTSVLSASLFLILAAGAARGDEPAAPPKLSVTGTVVDAGGKPVVGATVYLREWPSVRIDRKLVKTEKEILATATTDSRGAFAF